MARLANFDDWERTIVMFGMVASLCVLSLSALWLFWYDIRDNRRRMKELDQHEEAMKRWRK